MTVTAFAKEKLKSKVTETESGQRNNDQVDSLFQETR